MFHCCCHISSSCQQVCKSSLKIWQTSNPRVSGDVINFIFSLPVSISTPVSKHREVSMNKSAQPRGQVLGAPREELDRILAQGTRKDTACKLVIQDTQKEAQRNTQRNTEALVSAQTYLQAGAASWASDSRRAAWTWPACGIRQAAFPLSLPSYPARPLPRVPGTSCATMASAEKTCHPRSLRTRRRMRSDN